MILKRFLAPIYKKRFKEIEARRYNLMFLDIGGAFIAPLIAPPVIL